VALQFKRTGEGTFASVREMQGEPLVTRIEVGAPDP
jgi:hypothetical protein